MAGYLSSNLIFNAVFDHQLSSHPSKVNERGAWTAWRIKSWFYFRPSSSLALRSIFHYSPISGRLDGWIYDCCKKIEKEIENILAKEKKPCRRNRRWWLKGRDSGETAVKIASVPSSPDQTEWFETDKLLVKRGSGFSISIIKPTRLISIFNPMPWLLELLDIFSLQWSRANRKWKWWSMKGKLIERNEKKPIMHYMKEDHQAGRTLLVPFSHQASHYFICHPTLLEIRKWFKIKMVEKEKKDKGLAPKNAAGNNQANEMRSRFHGQ